MEDELIRLLQTFGYPVRRQGSLASDEEYPDTFFTFWNNEESGHSFYDNVEVSATYEYAVNVYSRDPDSVYRLLSEARELLKINNWIIASRGYDVASDEITHTGRGMVVIYLKTGGN